MSGNAWPPWPKNSPELLAHYVNVEATRKALPNQTLTPADTAGNVVTLHDLRAAGRIADVVRVIYDAFARLGISYDLEPVLLDDPGSHSQVIRPPADVVGGQGTCVDLALVFAAACIDAHLLPQIVLLRNSARGVLHALVVVDAVKTYDQWADARGWTGEDVERGMLSGNPAARLWREPDGELWKRVADDRYLLIECTGFAATAADGRTTPTLSFDEARAAAAGNLRQMDHIATLDLVRLQKGKGYAVYDPPDVRSGATVYDIVLRNYPDLADFTYDNEVRDLIAAETARFVGRAWLADKLASFRASAASGYFCIVAEAGLGKTAIAADIASRERASAFFFSASENRTQLESCLRHLAVDIISRFSLQHDHLPERAGKDWSFLKTVLEEATSHATQILLVIDGVDEALEFAGANPLFMPARLPAGVHVVLTSRVEPVLQAIGATETRTVRITADDARQKQDVELFLEQEAARPELAAALRAHGLDRGALVAQLRDASDGNFMYLRYALDDLTRSDGTPGAMEFGALPAGLSGYYEQFWAAMKQARGAEDWKEWDGLYLPTIAALGAAMEPVTVDWIAAVIERPAREIAGRALAQWQRFLRHHKASGRWWIVHKSFADFLVSRQKVEVDAAHRRIADYYLQAWGDIAAGLPGLATTTPRNDIEAYGRRQLAAHLRYGGDHDRLHALVSDGRWYSMRLAQDASGESFQGDLLHALAAAERRTSDEIQAGGPAGGVVREVDCALALGSITSLSNNLPGDLLAELVDSGHWQPASALRAIRMNLEPNERDRALGALALALDEPEISDALNLARALSGSYRVGLPSVLWHLCTLKQGERALAEALRLPINEQAQTLGWISRRLPDQQRGEAISILRSQLAAHTAIGSDTLARALVRLFAHAPAPLLPAPADLPHTSDGPVSKIVEAVALRWAELGHVDQSLEYVATMATRDRTLATARLARFLAADSRTAHLQALVGQIETLDVTARADAIASLASFLDPERLHAMIRGVLADALAPDVDAGSVFESVAPVLPPDSLDQAAVAAGQLDSYHHEQALTHLAFRAAELGDPEKAMALGRTAKHSFQVDRVLSEVLPRLAKLGHHEIAVSYAERAAELGLDNSVASMLAEVSRHVSGQFLDRLRDCAKQIANTKKRRAALLGIAPRYAELGRPEEALALARFIDDRDDLKQVHASVAGLRARATGNYEREFDAIDRLPPAWRWSVLNGFAADMPAHAIAKLLPRLTAGADNGDDSLETISRGEVLKILLGRHAQAGFADEAWSRAEQEPPEYRYPLLAAVAPYLAEPERTGRLEPAIRELLAVKDFNYWEHYAAADLVSVLGAESLRAIEPQLLPWKYNSQAVEAAGVRYVTLGLPADTLRLAGMTPTSAVMWVRVAPHLDAQGVDHALSLSGNFRFSLEEAVGALIARLVELGRVDSATARIKTLTPGGKLAAVAAAAPFAPPEMLAWFAADISDGQDTAGATAIAALAGRYAALGEHERAFELLGRVRTHARIVAGALAGIAPTLEGTLLDRAIEIALSLPSTYDPEASAPALAALLPVLAGRSTADARRAVRMSADLARATTLASVIPAVAKYPATDVHTFWSDAIHFVVTRTRSDGFRDLAALLPLVERLGGVAALDGVEAAVEHACQRWP